MTQALRFAGLIFLTVLEWQAVVSAFALPRFILPEPVLVDTTL